MQQRRFGLSSRISLPARSTNCFRIYRRVLEAFEFDEVRVPKEGTHKQLLVVTIRVQLRLHQNYPPVDTQKGLDRLEKIRELLISYAGFSLQEPEMFPQPSG